ncbi:TIGR02444 family protein [Halopseudomonas litoralis]|uniref:TIGR02444 family protein n=1 Tax=Halopseudomonas litoralis TaxID=797277 RepID=A0A1H1VPP6_9GAMM|nr:TIGR02444 family protein [Halopseudomonas litoralis]SDS86246.1 TIGR02444 family protein [Halopseudomonas litoralis]
MSGLSLADYAGRLYTQPGVKVLLLGLQDEAGQDVLLLLTACWLGARGSVADQALWQSLHARQRPWRQQVIEPLRQVRRSLAGDPVAAALREQVKACELAAEWHQLAQLAQLCEGLPEAGEPLPCIEAHLQLCCGGLLDQRLEQLAIIATRAGQWPDG